MSKPACLLHAHPKQGDRLRLPLRALPANSRTGQRIWYRHPPRRPVWTAARAAGSCVIGERWVLWLAEGMYSAVAVWEATGVTSATLSR